MEEPVEPRTAPVGEWFRVVEPGPGEHDGIAGPGSEGTDPLRPRREDRVPFDPLAVWAFVMSLLGLGLVALVLGVLARARVSASGRRGRGLALAAIVLGALGVVLAIAAVVLYFAVLAPVVTLP